MDCSLPGSPIHGIFQARILEWVAISFSRGSSQPRDQTWSPALQADSLPLELQGSLYLSPIQCKVGDLMELCKLYKNTFSSYLTLPGKRSWYTVRDLKNGKAIATRMRYPNFMALEGEQPSQNMERKQLRS